eukprot:jgi/Botrbrau1/19559/Bobra.0035s0051.1
MSDGLPSTSGTEGEEAPHNSLFIAHEVKKLDTLAGLAVKYNVSVADIKRVNGLLSDQAMFAKDKLLIPTHAMGPMGLEYSTWAGMIVTQYGRLHSGLHPTDSPLGACHVEDMALPFGRASPALTDLQRYYGTSGVSGRDVASEPGDFRPGEQVAVLERLGLGEFAHGPMAGDNGWVLPRGTSGAHQSGGVEMTEFLHREEHAGERGGPAIDERLRHRRSLLNGSSPEEPASRDLGHLPTLSGGAGAGDGPPRRKPPLQRPPSESGRAEGSGASVPPRKESFFQKLSRVASQPALAGPSGPPLIKLGEAAVASATRTPSLTSSLRSLRSSSSGGSSRAMARAAATVHEKVPVKTD